MINNPNEQIIEPKPATLLTKALPNSSYKHYLSLGMMFTHFMPPMILLCITQISRKLLCLTTPHSSTTPAVDPFLPDPPRPRTTRFFHFLSSSSVVPPNCSSHPSSSKKWERKRGKHKQESKWVRTTSSIFFLLLVFFFLIKNKNPIQEKNCFFIYLFRFILVGVGHYYLYLIGIVYIDLYLRFR